MSVQFVWPKEWDESFVNQLRQRLEDRVVAAMSRSKNAQIRGRAKITSLSMGNAPAEIVFRAIRKASATETQLDVAVRYAGDAIARIEGLEIDIDTMKSSQQGGDSFYPFEMTLCNVQLDGVACITFTQSVRQRLEVPSAAKSSGELLPPSITQRRGAAVATPSSSPHGIATTTGTTAAAASVQSASFGPANAVGASPAGGGSVSGTSFATGSPNSKLKVGTPGAAIVGNRARGTAAAKRETASRGGAAGGGAGGGGSVGGSGEDAPTFYEIACGEYEVVGRKLRVQFYDDPLKKFSVISNFNHLGTVADRKIESMLRELMQPALDTLKSEGFTFTL